MGATLDALHRLQEVELQLVDVRSRVERKQAAVRRVQARIKDIDSDLESKRGELRSQQMEADRLDLDMKAHDASISKLRQTLNQTKTNKEYSAVLTQLNTEKADNGKLEEQVMELLNELDTRKEEIQAVEKTREAEVSRLEEVKTAAGEAETKARGRLDQLEAERKEAATAVPDGALKLFDRAARRHEGEAMAMVVRTSPKHEEYVCDGCNMSITIEQVNAITSRDAAVTCNVCGHILYMESQAASRA